MTPVKLKRLTPKVIQPSPPKLKALSLFSGIGGLDLAAHAAGIETLACCEIEPFAVQILNRRFPGIPVFDDVRKITRGAIEELLSGKDYANVVELYNQGLSVEEIAIMHNTPTGFMRGVLKRRGFDIKGEEEMLPGKNCVPIIDVIHGGFPCQDLSVAGKQAGLTGERSGLWYEMLRLVEELQPYYVVAENVRGACNLALPTVQAGLERANYQVQSCVLPASAFGAPHRRERLFVLGIRKDVADSASERLQRLLTTREQESEVYAGKIVTVRDSIRSGKLWPTPKAGACGMTARTSGRPIEKSTHLTTQVFLAEQQAKLWPTPRAGKTSDEKLDSWLARRERGEVATPPLSLAVKMWATPSSADCKGSHGGGQGRSLRTDIHEIKKMWPTPRQFMYKDSTTDRNKGNLGEKVGGQLNPAWVEILMGYPLGWTDPDCEEPEPWPGWPALMGERLWRTPQSQEPGIKVERLEGEPGHRLYDKDTGRLAQYGVSQQVELVKENQYPYEPPRTGTGIPHRAARLKALGNSVVPAQAYPFFEAIAIMEEVRTQCNTASST